MIFLVKGRSHVGKTAFSQRLAQKVNPHPPAWPLDDETRRRWEEMLEGWWEADPGFFLDAWHIDIDRVVALVLMEEIDRHPPLPRWTETTPRRDFEQWRDTVCLDVLQRRTPRILELTCRLMDSVPHPVLDGTGLGTTVQDSPLAKMLLFRYSTRPRMKILLTREPYILRTEPRNTPYFETSSDRDPEQTFEAHVGDRSFSHDELIDALELTEDGEVEPAFERAAAG